MKVERIFHVRAPLVVERSLKTFHPEGFDLLKKKPRGPSKEYEIFPDRAGKSGGCTIVVEGDREAPGHVTVRVAFCKKTDAYNRKIGVELARTREPEVVELYNLPQTLLDIEEQMLAQFMTKFRKNRKLRWETSRDWAFAIRYFTPKEEVKNG